MADEEEVTPRPRTMKRASRPPVDEETETDTVTDDDEPDSLGSVIKVHGGWTEGQKVMDAGAPFAQGLKLESNVQIIKFMEDKPYANFPRHWVERATPTGMKNRPYTCLDVVGKDCPMCDIGDKPGAVSAFNVVVVGDDGQVQLKSWEVGVRLFQVLKAFNSDPKVGPLTKGYYAVSKTGKSGSAQTNVIPVKASALFEDYEIEPPTEDELASVKPYDSTWLQIPKVSEMQELALELAGGE